MFIGDDMPLRVELDARTCQKLRIRDEPDEHKQPVCHQLSLHAVGRRLHTSKFVVFDEHFVGRRTDVHGDFPCVNIFLQLFLQHIARPKFTAHHHIDVRCVARQENCFLHRRVTATHDDKRSVTIERPVTGRAVVHAATIQFLFARHTELAVIATRCQQHRL